MSHWLDALKTGEPDAVQQLWTRFYERMVALARSKLKNTPRQVRDEEDVALSAFHQLCKAARAGRFPKMEDRDDLWKVLVEITENKATDYSRHERRAKRGNGKRQLDFCSLPGSSPGQEPIDQTPPPDVEVALHDLLDHLLRKLPDPVQRSIATLKLEGWNNAEIADQLCCPLRTIERKLNVIRVVWRREIVK